MIETSARKLSSVRKTSPSSQAIKPETKKTGTTYVQYTYNAPGSFRLVSRDGKKTVLLKSGSVFGLHIPATGGKNGRALVVPEGQKIVFYLSEQRASNLTSKSKPARTSAKDVETKQKVTKRVIVEDDTPEQVNAFTQYISAYTRLYTSSLHQEVHSYFVQMSLADVSGDVNNAATLAKKLQRKPAVVKYREALKEFATQCRKIRPWLSGNKVASRLFTKLQRLQAAALSDTRKGKDTKVNIQAEIEKIVSQLKKL